MEKLESSKSTVRPIYGSNRNETMYVYSKDEFFLRFQETVRRLAHGDLLIMMGDMNARVGNDTGVWGEVLEGKVKRCAMRMGGDFYSSAVSTIFNLLELQFL